MRPCDVRAPAEPRCEHWRLDTQLVESLNSSVRININSAPAVGLPLLSSRIVTRRTFASFRKSGCCPDEVLAELEAAHPQLLEWRAAGGVDGRFTTSGEPLLPEENQVDKVVGRPAMLQSSAAAADVLARWIDFAPEVSKPGVERAIAFARGAPIDDRSWPDLMSLWIVALRYRSQAWCVRAYLEPERDPLGPGISAAVGLPLDCRKLLNVVETERARSTALGSVSETGDFQPLGQAGSQAAGRRAGRLVESMGRPGAEGVSHTSALMPTCPVVS
jgi:hypothetical protein